MIDHWSCIDINMSVSTLIISSVMDFELQNLCAIMYHACTLMDDHHWLNGIK